MATEGSKTSRTTKLIIGLLVVLVAILFWLVLRSPAQQIQSLLGDTISIRQQNGLIQWNANDGEWQTITTVQALQGASGQGGQPGRDGADGQDGATGAQGQPGAPGTSGQDGAQGQQGLPGVDGRDGTDGRDGVDGQDGQLGADGADGIDGVDGSDGADGTDGREIELQKDLYYIQWRYVGEPGWRNLIAYSDLKGDKGDTGDTGEAGPASALSVGTVSRTDCSPTATITGTAPSQTLSLGIPGLPTGGTAGQVLAKQSSDDCDAQWADNAMDYTFHPAIDKVWDKGWRPVTVDTDASSMTLDSGQSWQRFAPRGENTTIRYMAGGALRINGVTAADTYPLAGYLVSDFAEVHPELQVRFHKSGTINWTVSLYLKYIDESNWLSVDINNYNTELVISIAGQRTVLRTSTGIQAYPTTAMSRKIWNIRTGIYQTHSSYAESARGAYISLDDQVVVDYGLSNDEWNAISAPGQVGFGSRSFFDLYSIRAGKSLP